MAISFQTFAQIAPYLYAARFPIMLRGRHGIGKSTIIYQMAKDLSRELGGEFPVVERRASQMTEGDLLGLPQITKVESGSMTEFAGMDWLHAASSKRCILFFDEVDRATREVRQGIMELTDSRKLAGRTLHPETIIVAAVNSGEDDAFSNYGTEVLDPAEADRWTVFDIQLTKREWLEWARESEEIHPLITRFIAEYSFADAKEGENYPLMIDGENEPNRVEPSPRSWHRLSVEVSDLLSQIRRASDKAERERMIRIVYYLTLGKVGQSCADMFSTFLGTIKESTTVSDVLEGLVPPDLLKTVPIHTQIVLGKELATLMFEPLSTSQYINLCEFLNHCEMEVAATMYEVVKSPPKDSQKLDAWKTNMANLTRAVKKTYSGEDVEMLDRNGDPVTCQVRLVELNSIHTK